MRADVGEQIVGAYLKVIEECDVVSYNVRPPGGGLKGLGELDVIGLHFKSQTAFLCEVTTHIEGMLYGSGSKDTVERLRLKAARQIEYAESCLSAFPNRRYMFWSPVVGPSLVAKLEILPDLEMIVNKLYSSRVQELRLKARKHAYDLNNDAFRMLQILERLK